MADRIPIVDARGFITDAAVRAAYDRIICSPSVLDAERRAEAFLRLVVRFADRGIRLIPEKRG